MVQDSNKIRNSLLPLVGERTSVQLYRKTPCNPTAIGFILGIGDDWLLFWDFVDFRPDGISAIRLDGIKDYRCDEHETYWTKIVQDEGLIEDFPEQQIDLSTIPTILKEMQRSGKTIIIESEDEFEDEQDFYIGFITRIQKTCVKFAYFDTLGRWDEKQCSIDFDEITRIRFDVPYANIWSRHTHGKCPHSIRVAR